MEFTKERLGILAKGSLLAAFGAGLFLSFLGCATQQAESGRTEIKDPPKLVITPAQVDYKRKVAVTFSGSGFKPKQELGIEVEMGGAPSDVSWLMQPRPVPDEHGAFSSKWVLDDEIRRKLFQPKAYTVEVVDASGKVLASAPLVFKAVEEKAK